MTGCKQWVKTLRGDLRLLKKTVRDGDLGATLEQIDGLLWATEQLNDCLGKKKR